jgi:hypothetical protein
MPTVSAMHTRLDIPKLSTIEELVPNIWNERLSLYDLLPEDLKKQMDESRDSGRVYATKRRVTMGESTSQGKNRRGE